jgi:hypothetical protein
MDIQAKESGATMSGIESYWPSLENSSECLRTEAETVDEALLLAVHEPTTLLRREAQTGKEFPANEVALLNELMRPVTDGSAVVIAITGASGVGKSHMVRWLRSQLERHPSRKNLVVVSIPKTASLRRVVELILEPLASEEYESLRSELDHVTESLTPSKATEFLAAALGEGLREYRERIAELVRSDPVANADLKSNVAVAEHVRSLVQDPQVRELWLSNVLLRIVSASLGGVSNPESRQFKAFDLVPPQEAVGQGLPPRVQSALAYLGNANGRFRSAGADILQEVLDGALRSVFRITEAFQKKSIQDIVDDIRRQLLKDGKELVILIEDLAALSGIQQPLLDIMIAECDEHGTTVRAPIRTAVAVTDGFLAGRQTVLTRAKEQWVVPSEGLSEESIVLKLIELTGRYLNAARWGVKHLRKEFLTVSSGTTDLYAWVPKFEEVLDEKISDQLDAFGKSKSGYSLFPFNANSIRGLAENAMKSGGAWIYTPRTFINQVLRKTLDERNTFLEKKFPPPGFKSPKLLAEVRTELQRKGLNQFNKEQLEVALHYWAGNPITLASNPGIPKTVFDAFSLPWPFGGTDKPVDSTLDLPKTPVGIEAPSGPNGTGIKVPTLTGALPIPDIGPFADALEKWSETSRLPNEHARAARNLIALALESRLELGDVCLKGQKIEFSWFWLPPAATTGNPSNGLIIHIVKPDVSIPAYVVAGLKALARWEKNSKSWIYERSEDDYAAANVLLDDLEQKVLDRVTNEAEKDVGIVLKALHIQNLIFGISNRSEPDNPNLKDIFTSTPDESIFLDSRVNQSVSQAIVLRAKTIAKREELQDRLRLLIGCFQGSSGNKVMAIDSDRLKRGWKSELPKRWVLTLKGREKLSEDACDVLERVSPESVQSILNNFRNAIVPLLNSTKGAFGEEYSRVTWRDEMKLLLKESMQLTIWPSGSSESEMIKVIDRLSHEGIEPVISRLKKMSISPVEQTTMSELAALCSIPLPRLSQVTCDINELNRFFIELENKISEQTSSAEMENALMQRDSLIANLTWE